MAPNHVIPEVRGQDQLQKNKLIETQHFAQPHLRRVDVCRSLKPALAGCKIKVDCRWGRSPVICVCPCGLKELAAVLRVGRGA